MFIKKDEMTIDNDSKNTEQIKIIFLDIDGVLNSDEFFKKRGQNEKVNKLPHPLDEFDPDCVERLNKIVEETKAKIVISSDWRFTLGIENIFKEIGFKYKIYGKTPYRFGLRHEEIHEWLDNHKVDNYVILDDISFQNFKNEGEKFIQTDSQYGLTEEIKQKIINYLTK